VVKGLRADVKQGGKSWASRDRLYNSIGKWLEQRMHWSMRGRNGGIVGEGGVGRKENPGKDKGIVK